MRASCLQEGGGGGGGLLLSFGMPFRKSSDWDRVGNDHGGVGNRFWLSWAVSGCFGPVLAPTGPGGRWPFWLIVRSKRATDRRPVRAGGLGSKTVVGSIRLHSGACHMGMGALHTAYAG